MLPFRSDTYFFFCTATPQTFNESLLALEMDYQYTRSDGLTGRYTASTYSNAGQFGGEKAAENSLPTLRRKFSYLTPATLSDPPLTVPGVLLRGAHKDANITDALAEKEAASFVYISTNRNAILFSPDVGYAPPIQHATKMAILSWVNDTKHPTTSKRLLDVLHVWMLITLL